MKKVLLLTATAVICIFAFLSVSAEEKSSAPEKQILAYTQECPKAMLEYAFDNFGRSLSNALSNRTLVLKEPDVYLGHPFSIYSHTEKPDAFYFPVYNAGELVMVYTIGYDFYNMDRTGQICYTDNLSKVWVKELSEIFNKANEKTPLLFYRDNDNHTMVQVNQERLFLARCPGTITDPDYSDPEIPENLLTPVIISDALFTFHAPDKIEYSSVITTQNMTSSNAGLNSVYSSITLSLPIIETQGSNNWCAAYVTAAIIRFRNGSITTPTSIDIMHQIYAAPTPYDSLTGAQVLQASANYGFHPSYTGSTLASSIVQTQINNARPIFIGTVSAYAGVLHAMALCGYNTSTNKYTVWNPYVSNYDQMDMSTKQVYSGGYSYTWSAGTIYGW